MLFHIFLLFVESLSPSSERIEELNYFSLRLFADDTSLTATGKDLDILLLKINFDWSCSSRLTLNLS